MTRGVKMDKTIHLLFGICWLIAFHGASVLGQNETTVSTGTPPASATTKPTTTTTVAPTPAPVSSSTTTTTTTTTTTAPPTSAPVTTPNSTTTTPSPDPNTTTTTSPDAVPTAATATISTTTTSPDPQAPTTTTTPNGQAAGATPEDKGNKEMILYVIISVIVVLVVVLVIILAVVCTKRRKARRKSDDSELEIGIVDKVTSQGEMNTGFDTSPPGSNLHTKPVNVDSLLKHVVHLSETPNGFKDEFVSLKTGPRYPVVVSTKEINKEKNRFMNILAYDHTRVVLDVEDNEYSNVKDLQNDYVNANHVDGYKQEKKFIAAQGPLNTTTTDFWRMVWQNNCSKIVMVTNLVERGKSKCAYYWPHEGSETYGSIKVRLEKEENFPEYVVRILELTRGKEKKTVIQFHFIAWPDEGAPTTGTSLLTLQDLINSAPNGGSSGPIVIHCSAGIGRTGTFIAVDHLRQQAEEEGEVDVMGCVDRMRQDRINMVQSLEQYIYIYTTVLEAVYCGKVRWPAADFPNQLSNLIDSSFEGQETPADKQFQVLEALKPTNYKMRCKTARDPANSNKNRTEEILPADHVRPFLTPSADSPTNYINAVVTDSLKRKDAYLGTQMPLPHTQKHLWRLAADYGCNCIVMLNEVDDEKEDADPYWPLAVEDEPMKVDAFTIRTTAVTDTINTVVSHLSVLGLHRKNETRVLHIRLKGWPDKQDVPSNSKTLIDLYRELKENKLIHDDHPIIVHCFYGAQKTGLVCATLSMLEAIENNSYVDVFNVVKRIRKSRPQFVATLAQYKYLHLVAKDFVETRSSVKLLL